MSRVGGKAQLPAYLAAASDLKLSYSQFEELEAFARFGTQLDEATRKGLTRGQRVREVLKQDQYDPVPVPEQIELIVALNSGVFDTVPLNEMAELKKRIKQEFAHKMPDLYLMIQSGKKLGEPEHQAIAGMCRDLGNKTNGRT